MPRLAITLTLLMSVCASAHAEPSRPFRVAFFNIQSGKGQAPLPGRPSSFVENHNCTDPSQPLNAWGVGAIQHELRARIGADSGVIALGLAEAWRCGSPNNVLRALGWKARTAERNGVTLLARYGLAGPEQWLQLDTSLNDNPADTKWVVRAPVCVDAACSSSVVVHVTHWLATGAQSATTTERQLAATLQFLSAEGDTPHVLVGDLNVFEGTRPVCSQTPNNHVLPRLRQAGYVDAWPAIHGDAEGFTGMTNRRGCGSPEGYVWKRIDYGWVKGYRVTGASRFAMSAPGEGALSDHVGLLVAFERPIPRPDPGELVLHATQASAVAGLWRVEGDATAAGGQRLRHPDLGGAKLAEALAAPTHYVEFTFDALAGRPYRLWVRGRADRDSYMNDSVFVQFSGTVTATGAPVYRIGTTAATPIVLEDGTHAGVDGWGWQDNGYGVGVLGPRLFFAADGRQKIRIQTREDGLAIDQIVLSSERFLDVPPGSSTQDATILP